MTGFPAFCRSSLGLWRRDKKRRMPPASGRGEGEPARGERRLWAGCDTCVVFHAACVLPSLGHSMRGADTGCFSGAVTRLGEVAGATCYNGRGIPSIESFLPSLPQTSVGGQWSGLFRLRKVQKHGKCIVVPPSYPAYILTYFVSDCSFGIFVPPSYPPIPAT